MWRNYTTIILTFLLIFAFNLHLSASKIKGQVVLDNEWKPIIYLSFLNSFNDLNTSSYDFLIDIAEIDSSGYFEMQIDDLPDDNRLYRLHICKINDPISTIIIGGKDENFIHFIMKREDVIEIQGQSSEFSKSIISGNPANLSLSKVIETRNNLYKQPDVPSQQNRAFLREQVLKDFQTIADTSSDAIIKLLVTHFVNKSFRSINKFMFYKRIHKGISGIDQSNPYYKVFLQELNFLSYNYKEKTSTNKFIVLSLSIVLLAIGIIVFLLVRRKKTGISELSNREALLSKQEKRVLELLKEGKSNKEISSELNIEVSTVKSHLNKIYSRMEVKSRKELID